MDKLKEALTYLEAAKSALQQVDSDEPYDDKRERCGLMVHISNLTNRVRALYNRKLVRECEN